MSKGKSTRVQAADLDQVMADAAGLAATRLVELGGADVADVNSGMTIDISIATAGYFPPRDPDGDDFIGLGGDVVR